jgi:hypothetical protein
LKRKKYISETGAPRVRRALSLKAKLSEKWGFIFRFEAKNIYKRNRRTLSEGWFLLSPVVSLTQLSNAGLCHSSSCGSLPVEFPIPFPPILFFQLQSLPPPPPPPFKSIPLHSYCTYCKSSAHYQALFQVTPLHKILLAYSETTLYK